ncbi:MAG: TRAP transporter small permease [Desulfobacterales bacterium]|nr:TRAP transporter small permease [Desulfobacterales bacterium]
MTALKTDSTNRCLDRLDRIVRSTALWGGGLMLVGLMGLTVVDVILRYLFNAPIYGARDVAKLILLVMVALSVAYSARTGGQISIEVFSAMMGPRLLRWIEVLVRFVATAMLLVLTWRLWHSGQNAGRFGEASLALQIPFKPFYFILAVGMLLYAAVLIAEIPLYWRNRTTNIMPPSI